MKKIGLIVLIFNALFALEINTSASSSASSKDEACKKAMKIAQDDALLQAGTNVFSNFESSKQINNGILTSKSKKDLRTSSFGRVSLKNSKNSSSYDPQSGTIKCNITATFEVDTSRLEDELEALSAKYEAQAKAQRLKIQRLKQQEEALLLQQKAKEESRLKIQKLYNDYETLKQTLIKTHTFTYNGKKICGSDLTPKKCTTQIKKIIKDKFVEQIADKHNLDNSNIKAKFKKFKSKRKISFNDDDSLIISYNGDVLLSITSIGNPYLQKIQELKDNIKNQVVITPTTKTTQAQKIDNTTPILSTQKPIVQNKPLVASKKSRYFATLWGARAIGNATLKNSLSSIKDTYSINKAQIDLGLKYKRYDFYTLLGINQTAKKNIYYDWGVGARVNLYFPTLNHIGYESSIYYLPSVMMGWGHLATLGSDFEIIPDLKIVAKVGAGVIYWNYPVGGISFTQTYNIFKLGINYDFKGAR